MFQQVDAREPCNPEFFQAALRGGNSMSPQQQLVALVRTHLGKINSDLDAQDFPPDNYFRPSSILKALSEKLRAEHADIVGRSKEQNGHSLLGQLIALEIQSIDSCSSTGCIAQAKSMVSKLQESGFLGGVQVGAKPAAPAFAA